MAECLSLDVKAEVTCLCNELLSFFDLANNPFIVLRFHDKSLVASEKCESIALWVLYVYLDEYGPIMGNRIQTNVNKV